MIPIATSNIFISNQAETTTTTLPRHYHDVNLTTVMVVAGTPVQLGLFWIDSRLKFRQQKDSESIDPNTFSIRQELSFHRNYTLHKMLYKNDSRLIVHQGVN
jgi:hypothetical protein